jgi:hypothetical protein
MKETKTDKLLFPFIFVCIATFMYFIAFHEERDKNEKLEHQNEILKTKLKIYEKQ